MTASTHMEPPRNLADWLFRDVGHTSASTEARAAGAIARSRAPGRPHLGEIARRHVSRQIAEALKRILPGDPFAVLRAAWQDHTALRNAGVFTARQPGTERVVVLEDHRVTFEQEPTFDIFAGPAQWEIKSRLELAFAVTEPHAVVNTGRLVAMRTGRMSVSASAKVEDVTIAHNEYRWPCGWAVTFDPGLVLTRAPSW